MKSILAALTALLLASCTMPESSARNLQAFEISQRRDCLADYTPSAYDGTTLQFIAVRDGAFGECFERVTPGCPPSYGFGIPFFQPDKQDVYVGPRESRLRVMSVTATASGRFAFMGAYGNSGISELTIRPNTETMVARMGLGVVVRGRGGSATEVEVDRARQIMRGRFGEAADRLSYVPMGTTSVSCTYPRPGLFGRDPARCRILG